MEMNSTGGEEDELEELDALGPVAQTILVTLYSLTSFLALVGNVLVIMVELYGRRSARNLQKFLINLAIADLLIGVLSTPFIYTDIMLGRWIFHPLLCPVAQCVQLISVFVSTYTLTFIGIERYFVTLHPLSAANTWLRSHCNLVLLIGWIIGGAVSSASIPYTRAEMFESESESYYKCKHADGPSKDMKIYTLLIFVLTFALPMLFLTISYGAIGRRLLRTQHHWCSFKQSTPFSVGQQTTSRTQTNNHRPSSSNNNSVSVERSHSALRGSVGAVGSSSLSDSHQSASIPLVGHDLGNLQNGVGTQLDGTTIGGVDCPITESNKPFVRCKVIRQSTKSKTSTNRSSKADNKDNSDKESSKGSTGTGKVFIQFDRRNTEFLNKMRVFRLLVAILVLFILCWLPIKLFMLALVFWPSLTHVQSTFAANAYYITFFVCHLLSMANSFANPVLYCFMSKSFRADLMDLLACISTKLKLSNSISRNYDYKLQQQKQFAYNGPNHHSQQFGLNAKDVAFQQDYQYLHHGKGFHRFGQTNHQYSHRHRNPNYNFVNSRFPGGGGGGAVVNDKKDPTAPDVENLGLTNNKEVDPNPNRNNHNHNNRRHNHHQYSALPTTIPETVPSILLPGAMMVAPSLSLISLSTATSPPPPPPPPSSLSNGHHNYSRCRSATPTALSPTSPQPEPPQSSLSNHSTIINVDFISNTSSSSQYHSDSMNEFASCSSSSNQRHPNNNNNNHHRHHVHRNHHNHNHHHHNNPHNIQHSHRHRLHSRPTAYLDYLQDDIIHNKIDHSGNHHHQRMMTTTSDDEDDELTREFENSKNSTDNDEDNVEDADEDCIKFQTSTQQKQKIPYEIVPLDSL